MTTIRKATLGFLALLSVGTLSGQRNPAVKVAPVSKDMAISTSATNSNVARTNLVKAPSVPATKSTPTGREVIPKAGLELLENGEEFTLLSLNPRRSEETTNTFHGYPVLGQVQVNEMSERRDILKALYGGIAMPSRLIGAGCFDPRHGIRAKKGGEVEDLVICFQCGQIYLHGSTNGELYVDRTPAPSFNRILAAAHIPISE